MPCGAGSRNIVEDAIRVVLRISGFRFEIGTSIAARYSGPPLERSAIWV
jgi:hypothetical protein